MRLIDADEFAEEVASSVQDDFHPHTKIAINSFAKWISEQPTVDAVEVVRCRDCKKLLAFADGHLSCCFKPFGEAVSAMDYCSRGERRESKP